MKIKLSVLKRLAVLGTVLFLGGCATNGNGYLTKTMDDKQFVMAEAEERNAYLQAVADEDAALQQKKTTEYMAGRPVTYGDKKTGYTVQWDKKLLLVHVYPGHNNGMMGIEEESLLTLRTDTYGNIKYENLPNGSGGVYQKPTIFLANVATQEGLGRALLKSGTQVLSSSLNGAVAAKIHADKSCGNNCGGDISLTNVGGVSSSEAASGSSADSNTSATALVGGCASNTCVAAPMD